MTQAGRERGARSNALIENARRIARRPLSHAVPRFRASEPPLALPSLLRPACGEPLGYAHRNVGGVSEHRVEQWDYYKCPAGCGAFRYRQRTRKLRRVV